MAKKGASGGGKKSRNHPAKTLPHPADFRALGSYGGLLMEYVRREHKRQQKRFETERHRGAGSSS